MTVQALIAGKGGAVPTIKSDTTLQDVVERLECENAGALVVTDDDERILGIITERDIARGLKTFGRNVVDKPVRELMTTNVIVCDMGEPLSKVLELMDRYQIHYVPITCAGLLCGIITMLDLVKYRLAEIEAEANALRSYIAGRWRRMTPTWRTTHEDSHESGSCRCSGTGRRQSGRRAYRGTGASEQELREAHAWFVNDKALINDLRPFPRGRVADLVEILRPLEGIYTDED